MFRVAFKSIRYSFELVPCIEENYLYADSIEEDEDGYKLTLSGAAGLGTEGKALCKRIVTREEVVSIYDMESRCYLDTQLPLNKVSRPIESSRIIEETEEEYV